MKIKVFFRLITLLQNKKLFLRYSNILRPHYMGMTSVLTLSHCNKEHVVECVCPQKFREIFTQFYKIWSECFLTSYVDVTIFMAVYV